MSSIHNLSTRRLAMSLDRARLDRLKSIETVASGFRINSARDDPAGLAVATVLTTRQRSVRMAIRNIQGGLNAMGVADSGLESIRELLMRMRELAMQGASGTLSDDERSYLDGEAQELLTELDRVARGSSYEGQALLSHKGIDVAFIMDTTKSMFSEMENVQLALNWFNDNYASQGLDVGIGIAYGGRAEDSIDGLRRAFAISSGDVGDAIEAIPDEPSELVVGGMDPLSAALNISGIADVVGEFESDDPNWRSTSRSRHIVYISDAGQEVVIVPGATGLEVGEDLADEGYVFHSVNNPVHDGVFTDLVNETGGTQNAMDAFGTNVQTAMENIAAEVDADLAETDTYDIQVDIDNADSSRIEMALPVDCSRYGLALVDLDLSTQDGCQEALDALDAAFDVVGKATSLVGAYTNRLESALNFQTQRDVNFSQAVSNIRDADVAQAASELARTKIVEEAATMALVQANQLRLETIAHLLE